MSHAVTEGLWIKKILIELKICKDNDKITIFEDNQSTITLSTNPENNRRLKHVNIKHHFIRDTVASGDVDLKYIKTEEQEADMLTKPMNKTQLQNLSKKIGMLSI